VAAALLVAGPILQVVEFVLVPGFDEPAERVAYWGQNAEIVGLSLAAGLLAIPFLLAMFAIMVSLSIERSRVLSWTAAALLTSAMVGLAAVHGVEIAGYGLVNNDNPDAATSVLSGSEVGLPGLVILGMFLPTAALGVPLLCAALWRSRAVPLLAPILLLAFAILDFAAGQPVVAHLVGLAGAAVVAFAVVTGYRRGEAPTDAPAVAAA
jgi:hypothetical protein